MLIPGNCATRLGKRDFADVIKNPEKERWFWIIQRGLKCNHMPLEKEGRGGLTQEQRKRPCEKWGSKRSTSGGFKDWADETTSHGMPAATTAAEARKGFPLTAPGGVRPCPHSELGSTKLVLGFGPPDL